MRSFAIEEPGSPVPPLYATLVTSILFSDHLSALLQFSIYLSHLLLTARDSELLCSLEAVDFSDEFAELKLVFSAVEGM